MNSSCETTPRPRKEIPRPSQHPQEQQVKANKHAPFEPCEEASCLSKPVYHSSAALGHQLEKLKQLEFDAEGTVLKTLGESEMARINFAEKVSEAVNISRKKTKYTGLISVDVPVEETLAQKLGDRLGRLKMDRQPWTKPSKASEVPQPDIMKAFNANLINEEPNMDFPALTTTSQELKPEPCSPERTFDLYKHMCSWDS